ncbi:AlpA family phage regulatory protein [Shewanella decolorationis]|uniref:AlpA family phage regulatory protein n=1 Tax=Shewanella decolorationis TaxID=256839 RepID=A0A5B8QU01_9GAMM|nr:AlpA family phage regulatory protein [Shewanella decolorationis]QDZ89472.1 AlpA family phage regulatory protein [Shewanella decolorationis]
MVKFLTVKEICSSLGVSRTWLYLAERDGRYPAGIRLTPRCVRFRADLHEQFVNGQWQQEGEL